MNKRERERERLIQKERKLENARDGRNARMQERRKQSRNKQLITYCNLASTNKRGREREKDRTGEREKKRTREREREIKNKKRNKLTKKIPILICPTIICFQIEIVKLVEVCFRNIGESFGT